MTRGSIREYSEAVQGRYLRAAKKGKGKILDEFTKVTGYHRKTAIRLFRCGNSDRAITAEIESVLCWISPSIIERLLRPYRRFGRHCGESTEGFYLTTLSTVDVASGWTEHNVNFLQPVMKLESKTRRGSKVRKVYDKAQTPYQWLIKAGILTKVKQQELVATYHSLNPVTLLKQINENLKRLWDMAERPGYQQKRAKTYEVSV